MRMFHFSSMESRSIREWQMVSMKCEGDSAELYKVEYVYEDENGQEYTTEQMQEEDAMDQQAPPPDEIQEVMIVERPLDELTVNGRLTSLAHETNAERDPDCKRKDSHHCWGIQQSLKLIESMRDFKEEMANTTNRREVWQKIHKDVNNKGLIVSVQECQNKWKNLIRSYKECSKMKNKDNMRFRYYKEMCDYFGGEAVPHVDHDYNKTKLTLRPLLSKDSPTVTFPPICFTDRQFMEYTNMKREEYAARQKRHEEEILLRKQELEVQKKKLEVMKKAAMANLQGTKSVNFGKRARANSSSDNPSVKRKPSENMQVIQHQPNLEIFTNLTF
ncbi:uncharacterized protein LOC109537669 isoform X2 [Dendroctonus ponderosae]|uniref:Myb/SANT-like DNA-binding domain-containing protein n=1 Tax=Dendroctonus ponderosae TaxID=77166 RepID=A0AAR5PG77_DENPD|nr:uncharacterized protein LOC109537669 isoform X2 [Dendroctonus ponderosae]KAH1002216.1 hypothetical protein HUJ04_008326 [Dendroctonus ponderosae]KAH1008199.1 hypothetical protein HUJ05_008779 [Dendroctonus ponderosae]